MPQQSRRVFTYSSSEWRWAELTGKELVKPKLEWSLVFYLQSDTELVKVLADHKDIFNEELGTLHGTVVKLHIDSQSVPRICSARPILFILKNKVE